MDKSAEVVVLTGEHIILEGDNLELEEESELELVDDDVPTDPYNTSSVKVLRRRDFK